MPKALHIVAFDVPSPPSYGGVIDVFYKIKALNDLGVQIHLHCFKYGREESNDLNEICKSVTYYERTKRSSLLFSKTPFIVGSRRSEKLIANLCKDDVPILFEGLHCCAFLNSDKLSKRIKIVRSHNIEHHYYQGLAAAEKKFIKRMYFVREVGKLERFEQQLSLASSILAISPLDTGLLSSKYNNVYHVPAFHPYTTVEAKTGLGKTALYHGNLEVGENNQAALFLVNEVFNDLEIPLIIAGNNPSFELRKAVSSKNNITLKSNISTSEIEKLISEAQVNVLPTFQATGIKLKLLAALFLGRHCLVNPPMVASTGLESLCIIGETAAAMKSSLQKIVEEDFSNDSIQKRKLILLDRFSNRKNAEKILDLI